MVRARLKMYAFPTQECSSSRKAKAWALGRARSQLRNAGVHMGNSHGVVPVMEAFDPRSPHPPPCPRPRPRPSQQTMGVIVLTAFIVV